jgi:hypothetical protein
MLPSTPVTQWWRYRELNPETRAYKARATYRYQLYLQILVAAVRFELTTLRL